MSKKSAVGDTLIIGAIIIALVWLVNIIFWGVVALFQRIFSKK